MSGALSLKFFEVGIPNFVCISILGWRSVTYYFRVTDLDLWPSLNYYCVRSVSLIFFEVGIPNLVCGCILGWQSVAYHIQVIVTLTLVSDLVFRMIVLGAYLLYYLR